MAQGNGQAVLVAGGFGAVVPEEGEREAGGLDLGNFELLPVREVPVSALAAGPFVRQGGTSAAHVQLLADAAGAAALPPVLVMEDGWRVIDGAHRLAAARLRGDRVIRARFVDCGDAEALVLAIKANTSHGLPLSRADRVSGARRVLAAHPDWSDRALAGITGLSAKTVASLRAGLAAAPPGGKRLGRDGRRRPVAGDESRRRAADYISAHPGAPLRQVARETDVSLGTVHDVSARLRRGASPERDGHRAAAARLAARPGPAGVPGAPAGVLAGQAGQGRAALTAVPGTGTRVGTVPVNGTVPLPVNGAVPVNGATPLRRKNHAEPAPAWAQVAAKMAADPAVRYTQGGKEFLRWMAVHAADPGGWRQLLAAIPPHWLAVIAPIADTISTEWAQFAEQLKTSHEAVR